MKMDLFSNFNASAFSVTTNMDFNEAIKGIEKTHDFLLITRSKSDPSDISIRGNLSKEDVDVTLATGSRILEDGSILSPPAPAVVVVDPGTIPMLCRDLFGRAGQTSMCSTANSILRKYIGTDPIGSGMWFYNHHS